MEQTLADARSQRAALENLFVSSLAEIERVSRFIARRHRLSAAETDDFCSEVNLAIIENNYAVFASFQGRSSLRTYLTTVIHRIFLDYRRKAWGKWRPSAEAQRRGPVALRLEMLLYRDGLSFDEAIETMRANFACEESRDTLAELAHGLPQRTNRRALSNADEDIAAVAASELSSPQIQVEASHTAARVQLIINDAMERLEAQDRLVLRMRFENDVSVADIARALHLDQKRLYRRIEDLLSAFRTSMEEHGLGWKDVVSLIERGQCHLRLPSEGGENSTVRPSPGEMGT